ncbi:hypothetical protein D8674_020382 [Pyrus ussuriensis x Pyrus communis]|uniref:Uncharacterized protein n=1 Tax=Pyrus ussuriensis x Pyrus communis TaxID=2448454 RepID=A0A5N5HTQ3_9ROSA|nr:hypothetical protein D8674_020382 [Pyrus ussuriensis x Pyrus communis]
MLEAIVPPPQAPLSVVPESSTSSVTHLLFSAQRFHRRSPPIDEVEESTSASTAVGEGADTTHPHHTQERIKITWDARQRVEATKEQHNHLVHNIGSIGVKFPEIDTFKEVYMRPRDELTEEFHVSFCNF